MKTSILLFSLAFCVSAQTNLPETNHVTLVELTGQIHYDVRITRVAPNGLTWFSNDSASSEGGFVNFTNLPDSVRKQFGYDPAAAAQAAAADKAKARAQAQALAEASQKKRDESARTLFREKIAALKWEGGMTVFQKTDDGFLFRRSDDDQHLFFLANDPMLKNLVDGSAINCPVYVFGSYQYTSQAGPQKTVLKFTASLDESFNYYFPRQNELPVPIR